MKRDVNKLIVALDVVFLCAAVYVGNNFRKQEIYERKIEQLQESIEQYKKKCDSLEIKIKEKDEKNFAYLFKNEY